MTLPNQYGESNREYSIIMNTNYISNIVTTFKIEELNIKQDILTVYPTGVSRGVFCFC